MMLLRFMLGACIFILLTGPDFRFCEGERTVSGHGQYILAGCLGSAAFISCAARFGGGAAGVLSLRGWIILIYLGILTATAITDWKTKVIYDRFPLYIMLLGAAAVWLFPEHTLTDRLLGAVSVSLPMLVLAVAAAGAFGGGDIKLMAASGWLLGLRPTLLAAAVGILTGGGYCVWMLARGRMTRKDRIAFGPFLAFGLASVCFWGESLTALV